MAFPSIAAATAVQTGTLGTNNLTMPSGISAGDLLLMQLAIANGSARTPPSGWTEVFDGSFATASRSLYVCGKIAAGGESSTMPSGSGAYVGVVFRITGHQAEMPFVSSIATGASGNANPPNLAPGVGTQDFLWLVLGGLSDGGSNGFSGAPSSFTNLLSDNNTVGFGQARRNLNGSSLDPGTFTNDSDAWGAITLAVSPSRQTEVVVPAAALVTVSDPVPTVTISVPSAISLVTVTAPEPAVGAVTSVAPPVSEVDVTVPTPAVTAQQRTTIRVRERPPLRVSVEVTSPTGRRYRWAEDEPNAANVPSGLNYGDVMPGGFESMDCVLPRKPGVNYDDLTEFSTITVRSASTDVLGEYRLERTPRVSGNQMSVSPGAVGWQAHLEADKSAKQVYVERGGWGDPPLDRVIALGSSGNTSYLSAEHNGSGVVFRAAETPYYDLQFTDPNIPDIQDRTYIEAETVEQWYAAPDGVEITKVQYRGASAGQTSDFESQALFASDNADGSSADSYSLTLDSTLRTVTLTTPRKYVFLRLKLDAQSKIESAATREYARLAVYGNSGVPLRTIQIANEPDGVYASDVIAHAVRTWAPLLRFTEGRNGSITPTGFVIPHFAFREAVAPSEIIKGADRYHLRDWAVWENRTFHYHERGDGGRRWRARVGPANLQETGPEVSRLHTGVIVRYQDVDGSAKTAGPTGSGSTDEYADLIDDDPQNPANQIGERRWAQLDMGGTSTPAGAREVGRRFLAEQRLVSSSGQAELVGFVEDDRGMLFPASYVRAGDEISFTDAADSSYRRIVRTQKDHDQRSTQIDLDAPPEGLDALLERLQSVLVLVDPNAGDIPSSGVSSRESPSSPRQGSDQD
jgi:hypothetical protein